MTPAKHTPCLLELKEAYKYHRFADGETAAINGVDLCIRAGDFVAITGPSGSGKSTLLNLMGMIDELSSGLHRFDGKDTGKLSRRAKARLRTGSIGFVFQSFNLIDELTVAENVELPLTYLRVGARQRRRRVQQALETLDMWLRRDHRPPQLSGGQQQRVAIARAVVVEPRLILADEPTGKLDSANSQRVMEYFKRLHERGATLVMATHATANAQYAQRTIELFDGTILVSEDEYIATSTPPTWQPKPS